MKTFKKCPLVIMLAAGLLIVWVITGVSKVLAFTETQMNREEYRVDTLPQYLPQAGAEAGGNSVSGGSVSEGSVSDDSVSGGYVSGDPVPGDSVSGGSVSCGSIPEGPVSGNAAVTVGVPVGAEYFADALFIGDSRTVGLEEYSGMEQATFYASTGLTVYRVFDAKIVSDSESKKKITIEEALSRKQFGKIYFMIGINEMGRGTVDTFMEEYQKVVEHLQELQPDAIIYVQAIMKVTTERSEKGDYIHNQGIEERNERIAQLADNQKIFYLDVNPLICDDTGGMNPRYTFDGVHLKAEYIPIWTEYLAANGVVP